MKIQRRIGLFFLFLSLLIFFGARWYFAHSTKLLEIARAQIFAFPFFIAALWCLSQRSALFLRWAFGVVVVIGLTAVGFAYNHHSYSSRTVLLAPLQKDSFATQTRITHDAFEEASRRFGGVPFLTSYDVVTSQAEAVALLKRSPLTEAVVWGDSRWLTVTLSDATVAESLGGVSDNDWMHRFHKLRYITRIPSFGMSYAPLASTANFISLVTNPSEGTLRAASELQAPWTAYAHRPYADLLLGNRHLRFALQGETYQYADLDCAIRAYQKGWERINPKDNLELKNALLNNLAVATYIQGTLEHDKDARSRARAWFSMVSRKPKSHKHSVTQDVSKVAIANFLELRTFVAKDRKGKKAQHDR